MFSEFQDRLNDGKSGRPAARYLVIAMPESRRSSRNADGHDQAVWQAAPRSWPGSGNELQLVKRPFSSGRHAAIELNPGGSLELSNLLIPKAGGLTSLEERSLKLLFCWS